MFDAEPPPGQSHGSLPAAQPQPGAVPGPRRSSEPVARPGRRRDAFFDNAKYLTIMLVAVGHTWATVKTGNRTLQAAYDVVYTFHMPAFIIVSGYFSRSFDLRPDRLKRLVTGVLVPYVIFETAYSLFRVHAGRSDDHDISVLNPYYLTWFLCALFIWRLTAPVWRTIRHPLPVAIGLAMLGSTASALPGVLDLHRVLQFAPCFVLGMLLRPEHFRMVRRRSVRILSVPVFALALAGAWWAVPRVNSSWVYRDAAAQDLGAPWWAGPVMVPVLFGGAVLLTACLFSWVPGRRTWFTGLGTGTLYAYLLHGFVVKGALYAGVFETPWLHRPLGVLLLTVLAAGTATLLCTPPVRRVFRFAMEPRMEWAFKPDTGGPAPDRERLDPRRETVGV